VADIKANGGMTATQKFKGIKSFVARYVPKGGRSNLPRDKDESQSQNSHGLLTGSLTSSAARRASMNS
jgi:hypothetical protein